MSSATTDTVIPSTAAFAISVDPRELYPETSKDSHRIIIHQATAGGSGKTWIDLTCYGPVWQDAKTKDTDIRAIWSLCSDPDWYTKLWNNNLGDLDGIILRPAGSEDALRWQLSESGFGSGGWYAGEEPISLAASVG